MPSDARTCGWHRTVLALSSPAHSDWASSSASFHLHGRMDGFASSASLHGSVGPFLLVPIDHQSERRKGKGLFETCGWKRTPIAEEGAKPRSNDVDSTIHYKWTRAPTKARHMAATMSVAMQNVGRKTSWTRANPTVRPSRRHVRARAAVESYQAAVPMFEIAKQRGTLADGIQSALQPAADTFNSLGLPDWLVHWGHPGNMAIVLLAIGGYGSYLGWQLRNPEADQEVLELAAEKHPQLMGLMFFFFAVGASGGLLAEIMGGKPVLTSAHATTAFLGLALLGFQAMLPLLFEDQPNLRTAHAYLGSGIMLVFLVHAGLGLQHGLAIWA